MTAIGAVWRNAARWSDSAGKRGLDLLLPPQCLTCDEPVGAVGQFCADCFRDVSFVTAPFCDHCAKPFAHAGEAWPPVRQDASGVLFCSDCRAAPPAWTRARAALRYEGHGRRLVLALKHGDRLELVLPLARLMARAGTDLLCACDLIVPVPLHRRRLRARRFNQAALLAYRLGRIAERPCVPDVLRRTRATVSLGHLGRAMRAETVAGAFAVPSRRAADIAGRRVLLVDDVMTTGSTIGACTDALIAGGAAGVDVLVASRVPDRRLS